MINMLGTEATFEILNVMEYSSARGRMSVIARSACGSVRLLSKGSDSKVMRILRKGVPKDLLEATNQNLHLFATQVLPSARPATTGSVSHMAAGSGMRGGSLRGRSVPSPPPELDVCNGKPGNSLLCTG